MRKLTCLNLTCFLFSVYYNTSQKNCSSQYLTEPIRLNKDSETLLDHVLYNKLYCNRPVTLKETELPDRFATEKILPCKTRLTGRST